MVHDRVELVEPDEYSTRLHLYEDTEPALRSGEESGFPDIAYLFNWAVKFHVVPSDSSDKALSGQIVQRVEGRKTVLPLDAGGMPEEAFDEDLWEIFNVVNGASERADMIQLVFHKNNRTTFDLVLTACFLSDLRDTTIEPLYPKGTKYGASGTLRQAPPGFHSAMVRRIEISAVHQGDEATHSWRVQTDPVTFST